MFSNNRIPRSVLGLLFLPLVAKATSVPDWWSHNSSGTRVQNATTGDSWHAIPHPFSGSLVWHNETTKGQCGFEIYKYVQKPDSYVVTKNDKGEDSIKWIKHDEVFDPRVSDYVPRSRRRLKRKPSDGIPRRREGFHHSW